MYNRNYTRSETFQDMISRLYPVNLSEVSERILYDENGRQRRFLARTCTFQVTDACSLRCTYCEPAGTKITMADFSYKNIEDVKIGDTVLGFDEYAEKSKHTRIKPAKVEQIFVREVPGYLVLHLENGESLKITENHKIFTKRRFNNGGKYDYVSAGSLSIGDKVYTLPIAQYANGFDSTYTELLNNEQYMIGYIVGSVLGDGCLKDYSNDERDKYFFRFVVNDVEITERLKKYLDHFNIHTNMRLFNNASYGKVNYVDFIQTTSRETYIALRSMIDDNFIKNAHIEYMCGFLAAIYDSEGSISDQAIIRIANTDPIIIDEIVRCLDALGMDNTVEVQHNDQYSDGPKYTVRLTSGARKMPVAFKFVKTVLPAAKRKCTDAFLYKCLLKRNKIVSIEKVNEPTKVYNIGTTTHTYIAESVAVHNCYQINKQTHMMSFETAKKFADMILDSRIDSNPYLSIEESPGIVFEFIGGEPFMNIDLIQQISDYIVEKMIRENHPWRHKFMFSICSNGVAYMDEKVQAYMKKYRYNISFSISIDGNKPLHDSCRVFPDGSGSYDIAMAGVRHFREHYNGKMGSKMTMAPGNITYVYEAVKNLIENDYDEIFLNCVYEKGWTAEHATILYDQFKKLSDFLIDEGYFENHFLSYFDDNIGKPMSAKDDENWCGGTGSMLSCDYKGDLYPCIRYMESSLGDSVKPLIIGNVNDGIMTTAETKGCVDCLRNISRKSQSTYECFNCPIAQGCSWCSAYNYQEHGTADKRATYICIMHKGRILSNIYYWNKGFRKYAPWFRYASWIPKQWALEIISEEEYNMLMDLIKFDENDIKRIQEMLDNGEVPEEYIYYAKIACETKSAVITNDLTDGMTEDGTVDESYQEVFKNIFDQNFEIDNIKCVKYENDPTSEEETPDEGDSI